MKQIGFRDATRWWVLFSFKLALTIILSLIPVTLRVQEYDASEAFNHELESQLESLREEKHELERKVDTLQGEKSELERKVERLIGEKRGIESKVDALSIGRMKLLRSTADLTRELNRVEKIRAANKITFGGIAARYMHVVSPEYQAGIRKVRDSFQTLK